ncbi:ACT domain-containing protein [Nonomuraea cavernae]|uniref:Amino acid-binding protein n=1 Tax=Nonomuraea cavernae TaxID=2045107 RepID=A0A918DKA4_9ACTN|nr:ACT domain-containing protein [Nonomuraea cavernae]MCA2186599.1 amino acid-binding protein [Nonomuraea cavernae]GGO71566.1 amino acid-binding protein [Nonomuraea cavernae]
MLLRLRVSLPDRPGGLGQVAKALGTLGADILQVTVLERETGRAVDDFVVSWPGAVSAEEVRDRMSAVPGVRVEGVWPTRDVPGSAPDYDLLMHVATEPSRGIATLVDALPALCGAEWSLAVADGAVLHASLAAPEVFELSEPPLRAATRASEGLRLMLLPVVAQGLHVVVARAAGPGFHRAELERAARIVDVVTTLASRT